MQQLATMLQHQDDENKKLRDILENFGKDMHREEHFEEQYQNANSKIQQMNGQAPQSNYRINLNPTQLTDASPRLDHHSNSRAA